MNCNYKCFDRDTILWFVILFLLLFSDYGYYYGHRNININKAAPVEVPEAVE